MKILLNNDDLNEALIKVSKLGFVPTMGSLHKGHISSIKRSKKECSKTTQTYGGILLLSSNGWVRTKWST